MEYEQMNSILFDTINDIYPIATSRVSILPLNNDYNYFPYFRFRFKDKDNVIYTKIKNIVDKFEGLWKWKMYTSENSLNYIILPAYVDVVNGYIRINKGEYLINSLGEEEFKRRIDDAIVDIPKLAEAIKEGFIES